MQTILLTGVTGQVGSALAPLLQEQGYRVLYLIRPCGEKDVQTRLREVLPNLREGLDITISGDVTLPNAGISDADIQQWKRKVDKIVHGAAALSFENSEAEMMVRDWNGGKFTIHRLPIVIGDSRDGNVRAFHGYYGVAIPFWKLIRIWRQKWEKDAADCLKNGVRVNKDSVVELPLYIDCPSETVLNMVTSDWVAGTLAKLLEISSTNQAYHLVHLYPPKIRWVMETSLKHLGISGVRYDDDSRELPALLQRIQTGFDRAIKIYRQYLKHGTIFTCDNLKRALGDHYVPPPAVDEALLAKMLDYAISMNFGQRNR